jgi:hypothetical protein
LTECSFLPAGSATTAQTFFDSNQYAYDASGRKFSADDKGGIYLKGDQDATQVNPGITIIAKVPFQIPATDKITRLELHDSTFPVASWSASSRWDAPVSTGAGCVPFFVGPPTKEPKNFSPPIRFYGLSPAQTHHIGGISPLFLSPSCASHFKCRLTRPWSPGDEHDLTT